MVVTDKFGMEISAYSQKLINIIFREDLEPLNEDWMKKYKGSSSLALFPRSVDEVSKIMAHCNKRR